MEIIGSGDRLAAWWKRLKRRATGTSRTRGNDRVRSTRLGREKVRLTPAMRRALPANRTTRQREAANGKQRAAVRPQRTSTAADPVRCQTCRGVYGALKGGRPRAHKDLETGRPCPGGGAVKKARRS